MQDSRPTVVQLAERARVVGPRLYHVALRALQSETDAEDVVQQTFADAVRASADFRGDAEVDTWLWRIGHRCIGKALRRRRRKERPLVPLEALGPSGDPTQVSLPIDEAADRKKLVRMALACLEDLPPDDRAIIAMRDLEGLSLAEIADIVEVSLPAIKSRLHRARLGLRRAVLLRLATDQGVQL